MSDLMAFLQARLDEDEQVARAAPGVQWVHRVDEDISGAAVFDEQWTLVTPTSYAKHVEQGNHPYSNKPGATGPRYIEDSRDDLVAHIARFDPARVLAEVQAKRALVEMHSGTHECVGWKYGEWNCVHVAPGSAFELDPTLLLLASAYADHSNFNPEWKG